LPETTRKIIFWVVVVIASSTLVLVWLFTSSMIFKRMDPQDLFKDMKVPDTADDIKKVEKAQNDLKESMNVDNVSSTIDQISPETTTEVEEGEGSTTTEN